jgi:type I restriction enzyme S subunit
LIQDFPFLEVCSDASGGNLKVPKRDYTETGAIPIIDQGKQRIGGYTNDRTFIFRSADLPVVIFGDHTCCVKHASEPFAMGADGVKILKPKPGIDSKYLYHFLQQIQLTDGGYDRHFKYLKRIQIPIPFKNGKPDLAEQKRIAAILDKADGIRRKRREALQLTDDFLRSCFLDMFGDPVTNPKGWEVVDFKDIGSSRLGKMLDKGKETGDCQFPYLANFNVRWGYFELDNLREMDFGVADRVEFELKDGDLLICEGGEVGRAAIWRNKQQNVYFQKALHRVRLDPKKALPEFGQYFMWFMAKHGGFKDFTNSATIAHLTGAKLKGLPVSLPPLDLQKRFAQIFLAHESEKALATKHLDQCEDLIASLQQRAFKGEL